MISTRRKKNQQKKQSSQLDETLIDFVIGNSVNVNFSEKEYLERQTNGHSNVFEWIDNIVRQNHVIGNEIDNQIARMVNSAVKTVENCMHDEILTTIGNLVFPRVEMTVKSITGSAGHGTRSDIQNPDQIEFAGNIRYTPLMSASSQLDSDNELNRNDETFNDVDFEDGDFPAGKSSCDRREYAHHTGLLQLRNKVENI